MRFYSGLKPEDVLSMPGYQVRILLRYMPALGASELQDAVMASSVPFMAAGQARQLGRHLAAQAQPLVPRRPAEFSLAREQIEHDPAKAAEWFAAHGARINGERQHGPEDAEAPAEASGEH